MMRSSAKQTKYYAFIYSSAKRNQFQQNTTISLSGQTIGQSSVLQLSSEFIYGPSYAVPLRAGALEAFAAYEILDDTQPIRWKWYSKTAAVASAGAYKAH